jgi:hypothetical protein
MWTTDNQRILLMTLFYSPWSRLSSEVVKRLYHICQYMYHIMLDNYQHPNSLSVHLLTIICTKISIP